MNKITMTLLFIVGMIFQATACNHPDDYAALYALYQSTDGANWVVSTNWDVSAVPPNVPAGLDMSTWEGITCQSGRVVGIFLPNNNLTGTIPAEIGLLSALTDILLNSNNLSGLIPVEVSNLSNLKSWLTRDNSLSGNILPLSNLTQLEAINVSNNDHTGDIPYSIGDLTSLRRLFFENNEFTGDIPSSFGQLSNLGMRK